MFRLVQLYIKDEKALDDSVMKIMFVVIGIAVVGAIGYFVYNMVAGQATNATESLENSTNPGAGNEFSQNSFFN